MCGISAILDFGSGLPIHTAVLRMHEQIPHRGRDGEGFLFVDASLRALRVSRAVDVRRLPYTQPWRLGAAFRWLKIQDLDDTATQPMGSRDGLVWLLFNGEIYNFAELRKALQQQGFQFTTHSDTEVLLAAYQAWGTDCFTRFNGMWAVVIIDLRNQKVVISRDRFGIKPLFYHCDGQRLLVASEIKQIVSLPAIHAQANLKRVVDFIRGVRAQSCEETYFEDIMSVPAATYAELHLSSSHMMPLAFQPYWRLADFYCADPGMAPSFVEACTRLDDLLQTSVAYRKTAAVSVGSLLSGGLDSSIITAISSELGKQLGTIMPSFSLIFSDEKALDESPYIDAVVEHCGLRKFTTTFDATWAKANMRTLTWVQEEPLVGMPIVAQYRVYQLAAEHKCRVILDGQGADELLAGYPRHQQVLLWDWLLHRRLLAFAQELVLQTLTEPRLLSRMVRRVASMWRRLQHGTSTFATACLSDDVKSMLRQNHLRDAHPTPSLDPSGLNRTLYRDVQHGNLKAVLAISDRNAMAHTIEARVPYLDHRLVEFVFQLPDSYKAGHGLRKRILRHIAGRYIPPVVVKRRDRIGFGTPVEKWLRTSFRDALCETLGTPALRTSALFNQACLAEAVAGFYTDYHVNSAAIWRLYAIGQWATAFNMSLG